MNARSDFKIPTSLLCHGIERARLGRGQDLAQQQPLLPQWSIITYHFPAKGNRPEVKVIWYDGGKLQEKLAHLEAERTLEDNGCAIIGEKAGLLGGSHATPPRLIPESYRQTFPRPAATIPRSIGDRLEWVRAGLAGKPEDAKSGSWYSAPFTEALLVDLSAVRFQKRIEWDATNLKASNCPEADAIIKKTYREGWKLPV